nr:hypothetical protein [Bacillus cereus group sp. BfR-BA-01346]
MRINKLNEIKKRVIEFIEKPKKDLNYWQNCAGCFEIIVIYLYCEKWRKREKSIYSVGAFSFAQNKRTQRTNTTNEKTRRYVFLI